MLIQAFHQNGVVVEVPDLATAKQKMRIRVLHVDDDRSILEISKLMLIDLESSFDIDNASSVDEAFKKLSTQQYDVVVSDYEMPNKNGLQFLKELRDEKNGIPFILFTGKGREDVVIEALNLGADHYVNKQGSPETVYSELAHLVSSAVEKQRAKLKNENDSLAFHNVNDAIVYSDANFIINAWNKAAEELFGYSSNEVLQKSIFDFFGKIQKKPIFNDLMHELKTTGQFQGEIIYQNKRGQLRNGQLHIVSMQSENGKFLGNVAVCNDITERKNAEEHLNNLKEFDERILDSLGDALLIIDPENFSILNANKISYEQLKCERKDLIGRTCYEATHSRSSPCEAPNDICPIREMVKTGKQVTVEHTHFNSQQNEVIVEISAFPVKNDQGKTVIIHIARDVTQKKLMERELKENEVKFRGITNSVRDAIILADDQAKVTHWNPAAEKIFGYSNKEAIGKDVHQLVVPSTMSKVGKECIKIGVKTFAETGEGSFMVGNVELIGLRKDGSEFPAEMSLSPLNLGDKWNAVGVVKDITERVQAEQKVKEAEKRYRTLFSQAPLGVLVIDPQTKKVVEFNDVAHIQLGYSREEFSELRLPDFEAKKTVDEIDAEVTRILVTGKDEFETIHRTKNGEIRNVLITVRAIELGNKPFLGCVFHDITDIRKIQNELMESETKYRQLVNVAQEGIWAFDINYRTIFVNPQMTQMLGYSQEEMLGKSIFEFLDEKHIEKAEQILGHFKHGVKENFEYEFARKDDSRIYVNIAASVIRDDEGIASGTLAMVSDITYRKVLENKVSNYSKHLKCMVDLRTAQLKDANERLVKSERLAAIGELAGMVGHDLRNPLAAMKNAVYYLKKKDTAISEAKAKEMLELIGKAIDHSDKIINDLLDYSREMHFELTKYAASSLVNNAIGMIQVPDRIKISNQVQEEVWIWVDADKITRVFVNLIKNAIDAMPEKGTVKISSCKRRNRVEIDFADTGIGISEETLPKLFSPLFTTKAQGMGFGLAICKRLIEAHGGSITVKTAVNKGTTFTIALPTKPKVASN